VQCTILDRSRLAVEVINGTLRSLSDAAKTATDSKIGTQRNVAPPPKDVSKGQTTGNSVAMGGSKVLQARCGNSPDPSSALLDGLDHLASCCSISISFLISVDGADGLPPMQPLQTENARLSLASKLIQLGKVELALSELKMLKGRLQRSMLSGNGIASWLVEEPKEKRSEINNSVGKLSSRMKGPGKENGMEVDPKAERDDLLTILEFPQVSSSSPAFPLVISYQLAVLRCIAGLKRPDVIDVRIYSSGL
jgi:separase